MQISRLGDNSMAECLALAADREWAPERHKWQLLFELGEVWGVREPGGGVVATATATRFGDVVAVGNVLVAKRLEGRGLGRRLMEHVLGRNEGAVFILNATPLGRPLYEKLGFLAVGSTRTYRGVYAAGAGEAGRRTRAAVAADLPAIARLDAAAYGADREPLLRRLLDGFADAAVVVEREGSPAGFAARWRNTGDVQVGPVVAQSADDVEALLAGLGRGADGVLRVDVNDRDTAIGTWATAHGLTAAGESTLMVHGAAVFPGRRELWYSAVFQALG